MRGGARRPMDFPGRSPGPPARPREAHRRASRIALGLLFLTLGSCGQDPNLVPGQELEGEYTRLHRVFVFHGNEPVEVEVTDRLVLAAVGAEALRFHLELFAVSGKECRIEGLAERQRRRFAYRGSGADRGCTLWLESRVGGVVVTDVDSSCGRAHCGEPGAIGRLSFVPRAGSG